MDNDNAFHSRLSVGMSHRAGHGIISAIAEVIRSMDI